MKVRLLLTLGLLTVAGSLAQAQSPWGACWRDFRANNLWPSPYAEMDAKTVEPFFAIQAEKGLRMQNLLADHHFTSAGELTEAGRLRIRALFVQNPVGTRRFYVTRGENPAATTQRLVAVNNVAAQLTYQGEEPPVVLEVPAGRVGTGAEQIVGVETKFRAGIPEYKLPAMGSSGGGIQMNIGGGGGGG